MRGRFGIGRGTRHLGFGLRKSRRRRECRRWNKGRRGSGRRERGTRSEGERGRFSASDGGRRRGRGSVVGRRRSSCRRGIIERTMRRGRRSDMSLVSARRWW